MADQDHRTVIHGSPHAQPLHQLSRPPRDLQVRITAKIRLYWVNHHQTRAEVNNDPPDPFIIQCQAVMRFFINNCTQLPITAPVYMVQICFKSWLPGDPMNRLTELTPLWLTIRKNSPFTVGKRKAVRITGRLSVGLWISTQPSSLPAGMETKTTPGLSGPRSIKRMSLP